MPIFPQNSGLAGAPWVICGHLESTASIGKGLSGQLQTDGCLQ